MEFYKSLIDKIVTTVTTGVKGTDAVFALFTRALSFLFHDAEGYVFLNDHIVALLGYFGKPLNDDDLPSTVKRHLNELNRNLTEAEKYLEKIKKRIEELLQFVDDNLHRVISTTELKRIQFKENMIKRDLGVCKMHITAAEREVQNVEKSVNALLALHVVGVATVAVGAVQCGATVFAEVASTTAGVAACGAIAAATVPICNKLLEIIGSYAKWLTEFKNDKLPKLKQLHQEIQKREFDMELLKDNMKLLDVAD